MTSASLRRELLLAGVLAPSAMAAGCVTVRNPADAVNFITDRSKDWTNCYITGQTGVMEQILAEEFVGTGPDGGRFTKKDALLSAKRGPTIFAGAKLDSIMVKIFDGVAVAFGGDLLEMKSGPKKSEKTSWTDTWLVRQGRWVCVASHESTVAVAGAQ